jgi:hypothetical protein
MIKNTILLISLIFLILIIYILSNNIFEYFTDNIIEFKKEQFIEPEKFKSEYRDILKNYSYYFNSKNLQKRNIKNIDEFFNIYLSSLKKSSNNFIYKFNKNLNYNINDKLYPFLEYIIPKSRIVRVNNIENNYPHTHRDIMFFNYIPSGFIIVHELVHIDQRINPNFYNNIYNLWGFKKVNNINNFNYLKDNNRTNPDGLDIYWVWNYNNKHFWIGKIYDNNINNISDATSKICTLEKTNEEYSFTNKMINLEDSNIYKDFFGKVDNNDYHPNEIIAEYLTHFIYNNKQAIYPAEKIFLKEYNKRFIKK